VKETTYIAENTQIILLLRKINRFKVFSDEDLQSFSRLSKIREYEVGEIIIQEGTYDCWVYFLLNGSVDIIKNGQKLSHLARSGDIFGEMGIIDGSPRSANIVAATKSIVLAIDGSVLDRQIQNNDISFCYTIYRIFAEVLAIRLRDTTKEYSRLKEIISRMGTSQ